MNYRLITQRIPWLMTMLHSAGPGPAKLSEWVVLDARLLGYSTYNWAERGRNAVAPI